ncbi:hypothetical protein P7B02_00295 [Caulobacter segnis]|uniref:hypothetical protein n=1 Tax=Caulobacter segnis TaxID=88688 RepID=UPI0024106B65|nr:hypothetical protein [Caulobacter segnis]MDG2519960.1 hypothetical protein [Caulobacter segnis]
MNRFLTRLKIIFLVIFAVSCAAVLVYHVFWVWPGKRCELKGNWWDPATRTCAVPVPLYMITGRPNKPFQAEDPNTTEKVAPQSIPDAPAEPAPAEEAAPAAPPKK